MMMDSLRELYAKYDEIVKYSAYAFTAWFVSWALFFIMLPFMIRYYGKVKGASLNYGFSWISCRYYRVRVWDERVKCLLYNNTRRR